MIAELTLRDAVSPVRKFARGHAGKWEGIEIVVSIVEGTVRRAPCLPRIEEGTAASATTNRLQGRSTAPQR